FRLHPPCGLRRDKEATTGLAIIILNPTSKNLFGVSRPVSAKRILTIIHAPVRKRYHQDFGTNSTLMLNSMP
ncbi:MAG: hypothetical protein ACI92G_004095, partial [Candidatus Pelagisphaera sp.]